MKQHSIWPIKNKRSQQQFNKEAVAEVDELTKCGWTNLTAIAALCELLLNVKEHTWIQNVVAHLESCHDTPLKNTELIIILL